MAGVQRKLTDYFILYIAFFIYSISSVFAKVAASQEIFGKTLLFMGIEIVFLGFYAVIWQQVLKKFQLTVAMSNKGITVIFALIWSVIFFHETITLMNIIGAILIVVGIGLVSVDD